MLKLGVNVDHVATLRQARLPAGRQEAANSVYPDPVQAALVCQKAGAHSIVMHLREDRRHIQDSDVFRAKKKLKIKFNLEMSIAPSIVDVALKVRPDQVTLVPERRQERTTEGGLNLYKKRTWLARCVDRFQKKKIDVSFFIDPDDRQIVEARRLGAGAIELHTGDYANAATPAAVRKEWDRLYRAAIFARQLGLVTHAGHGLDLKNVGAMKKIKGLEELNIGYSIVTRALWVGLDQAVREMLKAIR